MHDIVLPGSFSKQWGLGRHSMFFEGIPYTGKKTLTSFPSQAGMSQTKVGKNLIIPGQGEFG
jgi:hypothetical protein